MSMQQVLSTWISILPYLQVSLGVWQILKFTPLVGIIQGVIGWLLWPLFPGFFPSYALLRRFPGRVFKKVKCVVLTKAEPLTKAQRKEPEKKPDAKKPYDKKPYDKKPDAKKPDVSMWYLGEEFRVSRERDKLFVNEKMSHYISDIQWDRIRQMNVKCFEKEKERENKVVFVIGYTLFWEKKVSGNVMTFEEVLDCVVFDETAVMIPSDADVGFLPVDLSDQSKKIISKLLNLVGLFFQAKKFSSYFPTVFSIVSAVLAFPPVASRIYGKMNMVVCRSLQCIFDKLPYSMRRQAYAMGIWVENLKPCNDIELKVVRGNISVVIGGAAKTDREDAHRVPEEPFPAVLRHWGGWPDWPTAFDHGCIHADYDRTQQKCVASMTHNRNSEVSVKCTDPYMFHQICTFLKWVADTKSGSLKSYDAKKKKVVVRRWRESVRHYVDAGCPPVYELKLQDVIVRGRF